MTYNSLDIDQQVENLIRGPQYAMAQAEKDQVLIGILRQRCRNIARRCPAYGRFLDRLGPPPEDWRSVADVPPVPVSMFKHFLLSAVPSDCAFCMPAGPDAIVEILAKTPVKFGFEPIVVSGRFAVLKDDANGVLYRLTDAVYAGAAMPRPAAEPK